MIAGEARGRRLEALPGTDVTRPTLSQVKEAMFSIVQFDLPGARVLDLYAGSGQLGIEALSRGAASVRVPDENREAEHRDAQLQDLRCVRPQPVNAWARPPGICRPARSSSTWCCWIRRSGGTLERSPAVDKCTAPGGMCCASRNGPCAAGTGGRPDPAKRYKYGKVLL